MVTYLKLIALLLPLLIGGLLAIGFSTAAQAATDETTETAKSKPSKKIRDRRHPDYVRCRSQPVMGSLVRKRRVCMTNKEWVVHIREGNKRATQFMDDIAGGMKVE